MSAIPFIGVPEAENGGNKREEDFGDLFEDHFPETKAKDLSWASPIKALTPFLRALFSCPDHFPKAPNPNTITPKVRI